LASGYGNANFHNSRAHQITHAYASSGCNATSRHAGSGRHANSPCAYYTNSKNNGFGATP